MRITGGRWRSRPLKGPGRMPGLRPTPDALRERAFAILGNDINGARFLDLFAGTGSVGLEALSRGARAAVFVESHRQATRLLHANLGSFELQASEARVLQRPAARAIAQLAREDESFHLIWADPPFERWQDGLEALATAVEYGLLADGGRALLECPEKAGQSLIPPHLALVRDLKGGASRLWILRKL